MRRLRYLKPLLVLVVIAIFSTATMLLWNGLMPEIFGLTTITFWQGLGVFILCRLLFGRISPGRPRKHDDGRFNLKMHRKMQQIRGKWRKGDHPFFGKISRLVKQRILHPKNRILMANREKNL